MSEIKPANERLSDYLKTLSPQLNQFAIAHVAETVLPRFQVEEVIELRAAFEALQKEKAELQECAAKGVSWFSNLSQITVMLDLPDDKPIPSGAIEGVRNILDELEALKAENEALQKENNSLKLGYKAKEFILQEAQKEVAKLRSFDADNKGLKECNSILTAENEAQAKRIEAIETLCTHDYESKDDFILRVKEILKNGDSK